MTNEEALTTGGRLTPKQSSRFIDIVQDAALMLSFGQPIILCRHCARKHTWYGRRSWCKATRFIKRQFAQQRKDKARVAALPYSDKVWLSVVEIPANPAHYRCGKCGLLFAGFAKLNDSFCRCEEARSNP